MIDKCEATIIASAGANANANANANVNTIVSMLTHVHNIIY